MSNSATPSTSWPTTDEEREAFSDWQYEVANGDTTAGFREWLNGRSVTPDGMCPVHGGPWGDDVTCVAEDGTTRKALRSPTGMASESLAYHIEAGDVVTAVAQGSTLTLTLKNDRAILTLIRIEPLD